MAEAQDSVTTVDEPTEQTQRKGRFGFGRRKDKGDDRKETEWVETLRAQDDAEEEEAPTTSPFAAPELPEPEPEPEAEPDASAFGTLPESHAETEPLTSEPATVSNGDSEQVYERSWTRRRHEDMNDIHHFVDNVLGTSLDPARRRRLMSHDVGLQNRTVQRERNRSPIQVEGIDEELMIAFTFPEEEFRGARVVYETEGGYVLEVQRTIGNDDKHTTHQYYTVSRVGEVAHVLDKMRARGLEADHAALQQASRAERQEAAAPEPAPAPESDDEAEPAEALAPPGPADTTTEALPDTFTQPAPEPGTESAPEPEPQAEPEGSPEVPTTGDAPQIDVPPATAVPETTEAPAPGEAEESGKRRFGFGRKKGSEDEGEADAAAPEAADDADEKKRRFGFGRKKGDTDDGEGAETEAPADADDSDAAKKRGIFRFKKGDADDGDDERA